jgi:hypothetical protein
VRGVPGKTVCGLKSSLVIQDYGGMALKFVFRKGIVERNFLKPPSPDDDSF